MEAIKLNTSAPLNELAKRYVWWQSVDWSYQHPLVFIANVMNLGSWKDIKLLRQEINDAILKYVLCNAPAGLFNYRSWDYWHAKFNLFPIPDLPKRLL